MDKNLYNYYIKYKNGEYKDSSLYFIYERLNEEYKVSDFIEEKELISKIKELNYDYEKIKEWVEYNIWYKQNKYYYHFQLWKF